MTTRSLQQLYEDPATPLISGSGRARLQAQMLVEGALGAHRALRAVDVGCGTGTWTALAADVATRAGIDIFHQLNHFGTSSAPLARIAALTAHAPAVITIFQKKSLTQSVTRVRIQLQRPFRASPFL